ncbi:MAG: hypothetical protein CMO01_25600 [Thalassobius sp.]|nr:hypothetical protein [Thalassovita sp.]
MEKGFLPYKNSLIEYRKSAKKDKLLILFHGFGDKAALFEPIFPALEKEFEVWALSFPYHGESQWNEGLFSKDDIVNIIQEIISISGKDRFSLLGYSMGGKVALNMLVRFPHQIDQLFLLAPDGIKTHRLYDIHNLPEVFILLFKSLMKRPKLFFKIATMAHQSGLLTKFLFDFTKNHFSTIVQRTRFFMVADSIRTFKPDLEKVKSIINTEKIKVTLFLGKKDEVILPEVAEVFSAGLSTCEVIWLNRGHLLIDVDLNNRFEKILKSHTLHS